MTRIFFPFLMLLAACATAPKADCVWTSPSAAPLGLCNSVSRGDLRAATRRAEAAARWLDTRLSADVVVAVDEGGPASAVQLHAEYARRATDDASRQWGFAMGRTSDRPRHDRNAAPSWAEPFVAAAAGGRSGEVSAVAVDLGADAVGVLVPVRSRASCLECHGRASALDPDVRAALRAAYPEDRTTGFRPDEHLGFVWAVGVAE